VTRHALVLAAGAGRRFGGGKLLAPWQGRPLVTWAVGTALAGPVDDVAVVVGCRSVQLREALAGLADPRLRIVEARDWDDGISASLRAGIAALPSEARSVAVFLGDMPSVDPDAVGPLFDAVEAGAAAARLDHPTGPAHPIVFGRALFADLLKVRGDRGARSLLAGRADVAVFQTADGGAIFDVDLPADINRQPVPQRRPKE
jgi:molybdenum cofactor cytidylyltransferase